MSFMQSVRDGTLLQRPRRRPRPLLCRVGLHAWRALNMVRQNERHPGDPIACIRCGKRHS